MSANLAIKRILVYGGSGALGNTLVGYFKNKNYVSDYPAKAFFQR
jgi:hypothetical protein